MRTLAVALTSAFIGFTLVHLIGMTAAIGVALTGVTFLTLRDLRSTASTRVGK